MDRGKLMNIRSSAGIMKRLHQAMHEMLQQMLSDESTHDVLSIVARCYDSSRKQYEC